MVSRSCARAWTGSCARWARPWAAAWEEISWRCRPLLGPDRCAQLDGLLDTDPAVGVAPLVWLTTGATSCSPEAIKTEVAKLEHLRRLGAHELDLAVIPPERIRQLAATARRSSPETLRVMPPARRHPVLLAVLAHTAGAVVDEVIRMFDQALAGTDKRARAILAQRQVEIAEANLDRLVLLDEVLGVALDDDLDDTAVGTRVRGLGRARLCAAVRPESERTADGGRLALLQARFSHVRSFAPTVLAALEFAASIPGSEILAGVRLLQAMNAQGRRVLPPGAPVGFVPTRWQPALEQAEATGRHRDRKHYWELAVLFALQGALRSGEIWVSGSRRYADPASYLIPAGQWPALRAEALELIGAPASWSQRLAALDTDLDRYLEDLQTQLAHGQGPIRLGDDGQLHLDRLAAEVLAPDTLAQKNRVLSRLPMVPLAEILIEIDAEVGFTKSLTQAVGTSPRMPELEHRRHLYAALLAQAENFGATRMGDLTGIHPDTIDWYTTTYLREESALRAANALIVNAHHRHRLAAAWGGGTLSSSDGLRLPMQGKSLTARALSRYFLDQGVTSYLWVSDQHSTYGTAIITPTERDGLFTLDEILGNTSELPIIEHATDTSGQLLATFALYDLLGLRLSPRIANLTGRQLWRPHPPQRYRRWPLAGPLLDAHAQVGLLEEHWDELLRTAASLKLGHVSASLLVAKLQAGSRQHPLAKALIEHGKLVRTVHALRWFTDEAFRRRIGRQLNKGESLNDLRRFLSFAHGGKERYRHHDDQTAQALCLTLVTNACILSTTGYLQDAIDAEQAAGRPVGAEAVAHLSPAHFEAINPYGTHPIDVAAVLDRGQRRALRRPRRPRTAPTPTEAGR